ncbi:MAG: molybdopterin cofactor-binding domain-containing protein, partial [Planctomycetota bacterium]
EEVRYENEGQAWGHGVYVVAVEIDRDTGVPDLVQVSCLDDAGRLVNPAFVEGQVRGGFAQGLGEALMEQVIYEDGQLLSGSLMDYALPRAADMPDLQIEKTESPTSMNALGAKGVGEAGTIGAPAAILNAVLDALAPADPSDPAPYEDLYVDYLDLPEPVDGVLPDRFPLPFLDDGGFDPTSGAITTDGAGNRRIDDNEFAATASRFTGTVSGGAIGVAPSGTRVTSAADAADLAAGNTESLSRVTEGNVILTGSSTEPIRIDGDVAIDGDLVISGPIEGSGSLWVRGNVYVRGDLEYADAIVGSERQFGLGEGGSLNALGLTAGGNVVMGDPYRPSWDAPGAVDGTPDARWNFVLEQTALF